MIDLFAGPGGLGEGFASLGATNGAPRFKIALSVEMDQIRPSDARAEGVLSPVHQRESTARVLRLHRQSQPQRPATRCLPSTPLRRKRQRAKRGDTSCLKRAPRRLRSARAKRSHGRKEWVLVGGPPCQAYSLVGRSRRKNDESFEQDAKHTLYKHYLRLVNDLKPPVFVMENVKGILSSRLGKTSAIDLVLKDLAAAGDGVRNPLFVVNASRRANASARRTTSFGARTTVYRRLGIA